MLTVKQTHPPTNKHYGKQPTALRYRCAGDKQHGIAGDQSFFLLMRSEAKFH